MQETRVWSCIWEDPTCWGPAEPAPRNERGHCSEKPVHRSPRPPQLEKSLCSSKDPAQPKRKKERYILKALDLLTVPWNVPESLPRRLFWFLSWTRGVVQPRGWGRLGEMREEGGVVSFPLWNSMQILFLSLPDHWETEVTLFDPVVLFYFPLFIWG